MSGDNTTLRVSIVGDSKSAEGAMQRVGRSSDGLASKLGHVAGGIGKALGGATLAVGGVGIAAATMGVQVAAGNEQARISFTTMLGSAKKADKFLRDMQKFAAETPFDMPGLQTAASSLVSAGINADKVIPIMRTLGDVTSGMGTGSEGIQRATIALQQMNAAQKISAEDLNQLRDAGIPVYDLLSKATGKSKKAIVELAQKGKLGKKELEAMMKALESGKGLERFNGLMEKQSASLTGMWSTLKDTLGQGLAKAIEPIIPLLKDGMGAATKMLAEVLPKVTTGLTAAAKGITAFIQGFSSGDGPIKKVAKGMEGMAGAGKAAHGIFGDIQKKAKDFFATMQGANIGTTVDKMRDAFTKLSPAINNFTTNLPKAEPVAKSAGNMFKFVADHADLIAKALPTLITLFGAVKVAQMANTVVGKDSVIGMAGQIAGNLALASSNRALAAAMNGTTASQNAGIIATIRNTVTTAAAWVQAKAIAVANRAMAAAQWLVNAAMSANPIGIVVVALAALAAGLVYAYKNSETFRKIVDGAMKGVAKVVQWLWESIWRPVFKFMLTAVVAIANGFADLLDMLSNVPGFGWAHDAATKIRGAASEVDKFNKGLDNIDVYKEVDVVTKFTYPGYSAVKSRISNNQSAIQDIRGNAKGGTDISAGWSWVGEQGPELMWIPGGSTILPAPTSAREALAAKHPSMTRAATSTASHASPEDYGHRVDAHTASGGNYRDLYTEIGRRNIAKARAKDAAKKAAAAAKKAADEKKKRDAEAKRRAKAAAAAAKKKEKDARANEWARLIGGKVDAKGRVINKYGDTVGLPSAQRLAEKKAAARKVGGHFNAYGDVIDKHGKVVTVQSQRTKNHAAEVAKTKPKTKSKAKGGKRRKSSGGGSSGGNSYSGGGGGGIGDVTVNVTVQGHVMTDRQLAATLTPAIRTELVKIGKRNGNRVFPPPIK